MTPSLPAQIEAVRDTIMAGERVRLTMKLSPLTDWNQDCLRAVLVTLQQHERLEATVAELETAYQNCAELAMTYHGQRERLEAVVKAARDLLRYDAGIKHPGADTVIVSRERVHTLENALAAIDTVASETPTDNCLVEPAITPEMLRAGISVAEAHFLRAHGAWRDLVVAVYRAMYLSRPSPSGETEATLSREDIAENTGNPR